MNWGKGIAIALGTFMTFIAVLATIMMTSKVDLEYEDYYKKEIAFEEEIQGIKNADNNGNPAEVKLTDESLTVEFPIDFNYQNLKIHFSRPNNKENDLSFNVKNNEQFIIPKKSLVKGKYNMTISYLSKETNCIQKEVVFI